MREKTGDLTGSVGEMAEEVREIMGAREMEASFSTLVLSIAASAAMHMGLSPKPSSSEASAGGSDFLNPSGSSGLGGDQPIDLQMARFNIDLLLVLSEKTRGRLTPEEDHFLNSVVSDLQRHFVERSRYVDGKKQ